MLDVLRKYLGRQAALQPVAKSEILRFLSDPLSYRIGKCQPVSSQRGLTAKTGTNTTDLPVDLLCFPLARYRQEDGTSKTVLLLISLTLSVYRVAIDGSGP